MPKRKLFAIAFFGWMLLVTVLSLVSFSDDSVSDVSIPHLDKFVHFIFYSVATILGCFFLRERSHGKMEMKTAMIFMGIFAVVYGIIIEVLQQRLTVARDGNVYDAIANTTGVVVGLIFISRLFSEKGCFVWRY